ncbi:MAG: CCA tRNA nucleotidyltransferase [Halobacteriota archaeon]
MKNKLAHVQMDVLKKIKPQKNERERLHHVIDHVITSARAAIARRTLQATVSLIGSAARDTWISGDRDIDVFIGFCVNTPREEMERFGLEIGKEIATEGYDIQFAEHPYVKAQLDGFSIDIVPHYVIESTREMLSAVDRTPFHQQYVTEHLGGKQDEVRLLKQFLKGAGIYGAELRRKGFSGYLCELLVIKYGSFTGVLQSAQNWKIGTYITISADRDDTFGDPLVVIDPVDVNRNVAAAVSLDSLSTFIDSARSFIENPCTQCFFPRKVLPLDENALHNILKKRKTALFGVKFSLPNLVDDVAYPQLERASRGIQSTLRRHEFRELRGDIYYDRGDALLLFEMLVWELPAAKRHTGPPVDSKRHAKKFKEIYEGNPSVLTGPFIEGGRYVVEIQRKFTSFPQLIKSGYQTMRSSKAIRQAMGQGFDLLEGEELLYDETLGVFLARFFNRALNNCDRPHRSQ